MDWRRWFKPRLAPAFIVLAMSALALIGYLRFFRSPTISNSSIVRYESSPAYDYYLRARVNLKSENRDEIESAIGLLKQAVATDPEPVALLSTVMLTLNRTIGSGMQFASMSYDRFVFEQIKRTQEEARRAMARHVHDHVGNGVSLAYRQLELYDELRDRDGDTAHDRVTSARRALAEMLVGTRRLVSDLVLTEVSVPLSSAIDAFVKSAGVSSTVVDVEVSGDERRMSADLSSELFIVIREALRNTFKHAAASRITVSVQVGMSQATAYVEDNGVGFDSTWPDGGHGLALMTERVRLLGGNVHIWSKPDVGTRVEVSLPLLEAGHVPAS